MKIKKTPAALGLAALVAVSSIGMASATLAANTSDSSSSSTATSTALHLGHGKERGTKVALTDAQKAEMEAKKTEMEAKKTAEEAALKANDYNAWVTAVGTNNPILKKITATNFSQYVALYNLRQQEQTLATELGLTPGDGHGMGMGMGEHAPAE